MIRAHMTILLLAATMLVGCGSGPSERGAKPGVLRLAMKQDFRTLDPAIVMDAANIAVLRLIYRSLLDFDDEVNLVPVLAEALPTLGPDKRTWTIRLKKGVCFSNGREVVADDFVYSIRRVLDPKTKSSQASFLNNLAGAKDFTSGTTTKLTGVRAVDTYTLEFETETPDLTLPYLLALTCTAPVPKEEVEKKGKDFFRQPVGNGPFSLDEWRRDLRMLLKRNDSYSLPDKAALEAIEFTFGADDLTRQLMFERGELDVLEYPNGPTYVALKNDPHWNPYLLTRVFNATWWLTFNCELEPFTDRRVRKAFNHAIDKQRILKIVNGRGTVAKSILPPDIPGFNPDLKAYDYDHGESQTALG